jgi:hypothetical protein
MIFPIMSSVRNFVTVVAATTKEGKDNRSKRAFNYNSSA